MRFLDISMHAVARAEAVLRAAIASICDVSDMQQSRDADWASRMSTFGHLAKLPSLRELASRSQAALSFLLARVSDFTRHGTRLSASRLIASSQTPSTILKRGGIGEPAIAEDVGFQHAAEKTDDLAVDFDRAEKL
ncbi:hypothetical protein [Burkholderia sola]|uniref:hypothetical protein n=1 Tax=Burkholderia sola TaxID=2843302 RepID=UPI0023DE06F5|nr:hypothetical protein [Burkholderia sola]MDF3081462.1 hypothetical protein [Burkholderia sola]